MSSRENYLLLGLGRGGFGAKISDRIWALNAARLTGRRLAVFPYETAYDDPFRSTTIPQSVALPMDFLRSTWSPARTVYFDEQYIRARVPKFEMPHPHSVVAPLISAFELKREYEELVDKAMARVGPIDDAVALHIRRGDKAIEAPFIPINDLTDATMALCQELNTKNVYLNSDSPEALKEATERLTTYGLFPFHDQDESRYNNANWRMVEESKKIAHQESKTGIKIIYTMSRARAIVGAENVHFTNLAVALAVAQNKDFPYRLLPPAWYEEPSGLPRRSTTFDWVMDTRAAFRRLAKVRSAFAVWRQNAVEAGLTRV